MEAAEIRALYDQLISTTNFIIRVPSYNQKAILTEKQVQRIATKTAQYSWGSFIKGNSKGKQSEVVNKYLRNVNIKEKGKQ